MAAAQQHLDGAVIDGNPFDVDLVSVDINKDGMRQEIIILVIIDEKDFKWLCFMFGFPPPTHVWKLDDLDPVSSQGFHHVHEAVEGDRLRDERVDAQVISAIDVLFGLRRRHDHDRDSPQVTDPP